MAKSEELVRIRNLLNNTRIRNLLNNTRIRNLHNNTHKHSSSIHVLTFQFSRIAVKDNWSFSLKLQPLKVHHYMTRREIRTYFGVDTHEKGKIYASHIYFGLKILRVTYCKPPAKIISLFDTLGISVIWDSFKVYSRVALSGDALLILIH